MADPIALLGTSADPPTCGHQALLQGLLGLYGRVATWASDNPMKQHGAPLGLRALLLQALVNEIGDPRLELHQNLSIAKYPNDSKYLVCALAGFLHYRKPPTMGKLLIDSVNLCCLS